MGTAATRRTSIAAARQAPKFIHAVRIDRSSSKEMASSARWNEIRSSEVDIRQGSKIYGRPQSDSRSLSQQRQVCLLDHRQHGMYCKDIALALTDSLEQLCEDIMHWKKQVLAHPDLPSIQKDVQELYVVVFQYLTDVFATWSSSGWKRFSLSFDKSAMTKLFSTRQAQIDRLSERIDRAAKLHEQKSIQTILASVVTKAELDDALLKLGCRLQTYLEGLDVRRRPRRSSCSDSSPPLLLTAPEEQQLEDEQPEVHVIQVDKQEIIHQVPDFERLLSSPLNDAKTHSHRATHLETDSQVVLKLHNWLDGAVGPNLWIQGPAHVPSPSQNTLTAIALMVALQDGGCPVLSFFCDSIRTAQLSPRQILSELVRCFIAQLVPHLPSVIRSDRDLSPSRFSAACGEDCLIEDVLV